jgi:hypothetical protein
MITMCIFRKLLYATYSFKNTPLFTLDPSFSRRDGMYYVSLACNNVWICRQIPVFQRNIVPPSSEHFNKVIFLNIDFKFDRKELKTA